MAWKLRANLIKSRFWKLKDKNELGTEIKYTKQRINNWRLDSPQWCLNSNISRWLWIKEWITEQKVKRLYE